MKEYCRAVQFWKLNIKMPSSQNFRLVRELAQRNMLKLVPEFCDSQYDDRADEKETPHES